MAAKKQDPVVEEAPPNPDGVFVVVERGDEGNVQTFVAPQGDVRITEVESILKLGLKAFRQQSGLDE